MTPVIGQGIVLSEKQPAIFVIVERGNDFETRAAKGRWMEREERGTWRPPRASHLDARARWRSHTTNTPTTYTSTHTRTTTRAPHDATHVSPRVCAFMQFVTRGTGIPPLK